MGAVLTLLSFYKHMYKLVTDLKLAASCFVCITYHCCNLPSLLPGGCEGKPKPCTGDDCVGVRHAYCDTQLGVCLCKPGYEPQYDQHQLLLCAVDGQTTSDDSAAQHKVGTSASIIPPVHETTASEDKIQSRFYYPRKWSFHNSFLERRSQYNITIQNFVSCNGSHGGNISNLYLRGTLLIL
jgi:hypothetical protein